jgi:hypothetical protein
MWMNLHTLPAGQAMYAIAVTDEPLGTPAEHLYYDEIYVTTRAGASVDQVIAAAAADLAAYPGCRIVGVSNQYDGYIMWQDPQSTRVVAPANCPNTGCGACPDCQARL